MIRCHILIVDEFVRTEKDVVNRVFVPFLTSLRTPRYTQLTPAERAALPKEQNKQLYLSSIRGADEWSYKELESYLKYMSQDDMRYYVHIAPYEFGVKNGFINKSVIEQSFKSNTENLDMVMAATQYCLYTVMCIENYLNCLKPLKLSIPQCKYEI